MNPDKMIGQTVNLDIREWSGKRMKLTHDIDRFFNKWVEDETSVLKIVPNRLVMTPTQYQMLKYTRNMGNYKIEKNWRPEDRMWFTEYNVMEIKVKK